MTKRLICVTATGMLALGLLAGCDSPAGPPAISGSKVPKTLAPAPGDAAELAAVMAAEKARVNYRYRLTVLQGYYKQNGNMDKHRWTQRELKNLAQAHTFTWERLDIEDPKGESLVHVDEHLLVERVVGARGAYLKAYGDLARLYRSADPKSYKARRVGNVLARFDPIRTYMYFLKAEIPGAALRPVAVIPAADAMYAKAVKLHQQGKGLLGTFMTTNYPKQRQALGLLLQLVQKYPKSTKIALSAYHIGEIYKEYFNENVRAVHWYERSWQWDPFLMKPARFQAATVHDFRLYNRAEAVELYRQVIIKEQFNASNVRYAHQRIGELTGS